MFPHDAPYVSRHQSKVSLLFTQLVVCVFLLNAIATAQPYVVSKHFTDVDGITQLQVLSIDTDLQGNVWVGSTRGLLRWNGSQFARYAPSVLPLADQRLETSSWPLKNGYLFYRTANGSHFTILPSGKLAATTNALSQFRFQNPKATPIPKTLTSKTLRPERFGQTLLKATAIWNKSIVQYDSDSTFYFLQNDSLFYYMNSNVSLLQTRVQSWFLCKVATNLLVLQPTGKINLFSRGKLVQQPFQVIGAEQFIAAAPSLYFHYAPNATYINTRNAVFKCSIQDNKIEFSKILTHQIQEVTALHVSQDEQLLLIGSRTNGIYQFTRQFASLHSPYLAKSSVYHEISMANGLPNKSPDENTPAATPSLLIRLLNMGAVCKLPNGSIAAVHGNLLLSFQPDNQLESRTRLDGIFTKWMDLRNDSLFILQDYLQIYYKAANTWKKALLPGTLTRHASAATLMPGGIALVSADTLYLFDFTKKMKSTQIPLSIKNVSSLQFDRSLNALLLFSPTNGLTILKLKSNQPHHIQILSAASETLYPHYTITDQDGDYWMPTSAGLLFVTRQQMLESLAGPRSQIYAVRIIASDGLPCEEFRPESLCPPILSRDSIYLPSTCGVVGIRRSIKYALPPDHRAVNIESIVLNDTQSLNTTRFEIPANYRDLVINVSYPYPIRFMASKQLYYRILKENDSDSAWYPVRNNQLPLRFLSPGTYQLQFTDIPSRSPLITTLGISVQKWWYQQSWFITLSVIALTSIVIGIYGWASDRIEKQRISKRLAERELMMGMLAHDLRSPINAYAGLAKLSHHMIATNQQERLLTIIDEIENNAGSVKMMLSAIVQWIMHDRGFQNAKACKVDLVNHVQEVLRLYAWTADRKQVSIVNQLPLNLSVDVPPDIVVVIVRNLVDNAVKYAPEHSAVVISHFETQNSIRLVISNMFPEENRPSLIDLQNFLSQASANEHDNEQKPRKVHRSSVGLGYYLIKLLATQHRLSIEMNILQRAVLVQCTFPRNTASQRSQSAS